jgi:AraC family transcriptional regulator
MKPVTVTGNSTSIVNIALRPRRTTDLPVLYAVPDLEFPSLNRPEHGTSTDATDRVPRAAV